MFQIQEGEAGQPPVVVCPWGNHFVLLKAKSETPFGHPDGPGIRFVAFRVNSGHADKIAQFYSETYATPTSSKLGGESRASTVVVSPCSRFVFFEEQSPPERVQAQKGLHVAIYVAPFTSTFEKLHARSLVRSNPRFTHIDRCDTREEALASRQYRFYHMIDLDTGAELYELEHETRSLSHPSFMRALHNQPPAPLARK
mmetsp:Transcript_30210/g.71079  ORF Transcript_30210/g.71079 Transcript_30210/m.71079 type:complete len:199 (-) Transcript_30210:88-684(-)